MGGGEGEFQFKESDVPQGMLAVWSVGQRWGMHTPSLKGVKISIGFAGQQ